jgi:hypothetical protein
LKFEPFEVKGIVEQIPCSYIEPYLRGKAAARSNLSCVLLQDRPPTSNEQSGNLDRFPSSPIKRMSWKTKTEQSKGIVLFVQVCPPRSDIASPGASIVSSFSQQAPAPSIGFEDASRIIRHRQA